jgi:hypothetical protein
LFGSPTGRGYPQAGTAGQGFIRGAVDGANPGRNFAGIAAAIGRFFAALQRSRQALCFGLNCAEFRLYGRELAPGIRAALQGFI